MDFLVEEAPLPDRRDGVKLGESTLNRFLLLAEHHGQDIDVNQARIFARLTYLTDRPG